MLAFVSPPVILTVGCLFSAFCMHFPAFSHTKRERAFMHAPLLYTDFKKLSRKNLKNSLRTDSESPEELEEIISKIMKDKQLNSDIREAGIQTAKSFTWDKAFSILRQNIDAIINAYNYPKTGSDSAEDFLFKKAAI